MKQQLEFKGRYSYELIRNGIVVARQKVVLNGIVQEGKNYALDAAFGGESQITDWYIGLVNNTPTPTLLNTDTLAAHSGWVEFTDYSGDRPTWDDAAAADSSKESDSVSTFAITGSGTIFGIFLCSAATGTSGVLWSTAEFDEPLPVVNGDDLKVTYSLDT